jgi:putative PIN family toxin of toxin-antitoxin system
VTRVVLDTNVIVSAVLNARAASVPILAPSLCLQLALTGKVGLVVSESLLTEYEEVLLRPKFAFSPRLVHALLLDIRRVADLVTPAKITAKTVTDPDDAYVLGCAVAEKADFLVTGNTRHFPERYRGVTVVTPAAFIAWSLAEGLFS